MIDLLPEQVDALRELVGVCRDLRVDLVVIGAIAYRLWIRDKHRTTEDLDAVVALDSDEMPHLTERLIGLGWRKDPRREQRWFSAGNARVDLLPVGTKARRAKQLVWPIGETTMSLVGYDHVFNDAVECELAPGLRVKLVPLPVLALMKAVAYLDDPNSRAKDLQDLAGMMATYGEDSDRRFSDEVLHAGVDYDSAGAYLLGRDLGKLCEEEDEIGAVRRLIEQLCGRNHPAFAVFVRLARRSGEHPERQLAREVAALSRGFRELASSRHAD